MAIKERKQITGTEAQIKGYAGHNGVLAYATDTKHLHVLSGTAGTTTKLANMSDIPAPVDISGKADKTYVDTELTQGLAGKANKTYVDTELAKKQAKGDYATNTALTQGLAGKANKAHTHTVSQITDMPKVVLSVNDITPDDSGNVKVGALPLGHLFAWPFQTPPDGAIQCNGATYNRALYKDFFAYATSKGWVKTEAEWQEIAERDNGFCPFYSEGDGSTNFRTPRFAPFMQVAIASANVGKYHQAGLPNIVGEHDGTPWVSEAYGCFKYLSSEKYIPDGRANGTCGVRFDASLSSSVYGRSDTVQPESHEWMICVVVAGQATNLGSVDMADVLATVAQVQADISQVQADISQVQNDVDAIPRPNAYVTQTWRSGEQWYRVWSDGWVEQGGHGTGGTCTFNKPFSNTNYTFNVQPSSGYTSHPDWIAAYEHRPGRTTAKTAISHYESGGKGWDWRASGY